MMKTMMRMMMMVIVRERAETEIEFVSNFLLLFPPSIVFPAIQLKLNLSETFLLYSLKPIPCPILSNSNI